ncbi:PLP-dependent transferase [Coccomyxa subellipsoidea C-169]|uniref:PLP-dependent transferase n=1 Tax=Coccomyxa subellipsoidea (strain C-169) TaxID=574566 RepID=I0ZAC1_COCSC|nr:PLP-dependent transferase [Coccomyxa subellipsoidea C-169]EIE27590.1 PLP-dependent transferase [Coccomyxa subellipsoidea C-169]|eukprot:XP_005652134.1 PLP-dependent transferase [Coccomyxa subellipsoidea C-169]
MVDLISRPFEAGRPLEDPQTHAAHPFSSRALKLFSTNDYLGLSTHVALRRAAADAAMLYGLGPRSSALVGGYTLLHQELERRLAALKGTEECLLFPTGFAANLAIVSALGSGEDAAIFSDELNHASIVDGARLASRNKGRLHIYRHNDMRHLEELLSACPSHHRKLVVADSLFSMDGDFADFQGLTSLRRKHGFLLAVDEAHATLVCGSRGGGAAEAFGVAGEVDVHIGTLSKAVGAHGGFVACRAELKTLLLNKGRPYVFSTALPAPVVAAAIAALQVNEQEPDRREHLWRLVRQLGEGLGVDACSPIVPLIVGSEAAAVAASAALLEKGFYVPAIRPPTVAPGTSRLRISLSAAHTTEDVDALLVALKECGILSAAGSPLAAAGSIVEQDVVYLAKL